MVSSSIWNYFAQKQVFQNAEIAQAPSEFLHPVKTLILFFENIDTEFNILYSSDLAHMFKCFFYTKKKNLCLSPSQVIQQLHSGHRNKHCAGERALWKRKENNKTYTKSGVNNNKICSLWVHCIFLWVTMAKLISQQSIDLLTSQHSDIFSSGRN